MSYIEHNRSKTRSLHPKIIVKIYLEPNYANLVIKNNKIIYNLPQNSIVPSVLYKTWQFDTPMQ